MKDIILKKTGEAFLKFGFKSVTMDDIANELAISKKTIYKYFKNKHDLVNQTVTHIHEDCINAIDGVCKCNFNAIHENFEINKVFKDLLKNNDDSPMYQLKKYYPKIYERVMKNEFLMFQDCISQNIENGIKDGLYRKDIDISVVSRLYFALVMAVHDENLFTYNKNTINKLETDILEYHTRAIATEKGIKELEKQLKELNIN